MCALPSPPHRSLRAAELRRLDVTPDELRGPRWRSPFRGVHAPESQAPTDPSLQRILDAAELVPRGSALGGWAAGRLLGVAESDGLGRTGKQMEPVVIVVPDDLQHVAPRAGVRFVRSRFCAADRQCVRGIWVTTPLRTTFDLVRWSRRVEDGLVAADLMARRLGIDARRLARYAHEHPRFRGSPIVRAVLPLIDPLSRSSGESRLRYIWIVEARLPVPRCNPYLVDEIGEVFAMPDLLDVASGLVGEYDGSSRGLEEHTDDNVREEDIELHGLVVVRATSLDVGRHRARTVRRLRDGYRRATGAADGGASWGWRPGRIWNPPGSEDW